jgi:hypothetical protein
MFPIALGIVLVAGGIGYLVDTLTAFVALGSPDHPRGRRARHRRRVSLLAYPSSEGPAQLCSDRRGVGGGFGNGACVCLATQATGSRIHHHRAHLSQPTERRQPTFAVIENRRSSAARDLALRWLGQPDMGPTLAPSGGSRQFELTTSGCDRDRQQPERGHRQGVNQRRTSADPGRGSQTAFMATRSGSVIMPIRGQ